MVKKGDYVSGYYYIPGEKRWVEGVLEGVAGGENEYYLVKTAVWTYWCDEVFLHKKAYLKKYFNG